MARAPALFRQRDAEALVRAVRKGGCDVARVEMTPDGKIVVIIGKPGEEAVKPANEWDAET